MPSAGTFHPENASAREQSASTASPVSPVCSDQSPVGAAASTGVPRAPYRPTAVQGSAGVAHGANRRSRISAPSQARPTPLPKRPKGQLFIGLVLLVVCGSVIYTIWNSWFRYEAHGIVAGRVIRVSPPWSGTLQTFHVREGDEVRQGQLLVTIRNHEREQELLRIADQLRLAQAELASQVSQLKWQSQLQGDRSQQALSDYYELWGSLLAERSELAQAETELLRMRETQGRNALAVSQKELDAAQFKVQGLAAKIDKLEVAVEQMKERVEIYEQLEDNVSDQFRPQLLQIEILQAELLRIREQIDLGQVRSPVNGTVVRILRYAGEYADATQTVVEIVEDASLRPVLYLTQDHANALSVGQGINVLIAPQSTTIQCRVERIGDQFEPAPSSIQRYYDNNERLLPVVLRPRHDVGSNASMFLHSEVRLTRRWFRPLADMLVDNETASKDVIDSQPQ